MSGVSPEQICVLLQNCQAAWEYLNAWEREFIESISLRSGPNTMVILTERQRQTLLRTWWKLPPKKRNLSWEPDDDGNSPPGFRRKFDNDRPF